MQVGGIWETEMATTWNVFFSLPKKSDSINLWKKIQFAILEGHSKNMPSYIHWKNKMVTCPRYSTCIPDRV